MTDKPVSVVGDHVIAAMIEEARKTPDGCFAEVGVYKGGTGWHLAKLAVEQERQLFLFDTFTGIPYRGIYDSHCPGDFNDTTFEAVCEAIPYATVVKGIFPASAENCDLPEKVAFVHLDCDQYQSVKESAEFFIPRMIPGGVMWFDDYGCLEGANMAVKELFDGRIEMSQVGKAFVRF